MLSTSFFLRGLTDMLRNRWCPLHPTMELISIMARIPCSVTLFQLVRCPLFLSLPGLYFTLLRLMILGIHTFRSGGLLFLHVFSLKSPVKLQHIISTAPISPKTKLIHGTAGLSVSSAPLPRRAESANSPGRDLEGLPLLNWQILRGLQADLADGPLAQYPSLWGARACTMSQVRQEVGMSAVAARAPQGRQMGPNRFVVFKWRGAS